MAHQTTSVLNLLKDKTGIILGFIIGMAGFLFLFKIIILDRIAPADELAPGMVMIAAIVSGAVCAFVGRKIQHYWMRTR